MSNRTETAADRAEPMDANLHKELADRLGVLVYRLGRQARGHYVAAKSATRTDNWLGGLLIVVTSLTTTGVVATALEDGSRPLAIASAALGATAAILSGMKKAGNYSERATKFQAAATRYERLLADARRLQFDVAQLPAGRVDNGPDLLHDLEVRRADCSAEVPDLADRYYDRAVRATASRADEAAASETAEHR